MALSAAAGLRERGVDCGISTGAAAREGSKPSEPEVAALPDEPLGEGESRHSFLRANEREMKRNRRLIK